MAKKSYLVACDLEGGQIETYKIKTPADYIPESDDLNLIKETVVKRFAPRWHHAYASPDSCGGSVNITETSTTICVKDLSVIALSRIDQ